MNNWVTLVDYDKNPCEYQKLKAEIEATAEYVLSFGPASVYGEKAEIYRLNDELYKFSHDMYGIVDIEKLEGVGHFVFVPGGDKVYAKGRRDL